MKKLFRFKSLGFALLLVFASILTMAASGCDDVHKASVAAGSIAASLRTVAEVNHTSTLIAADERVTVANLIVQAAAANDSFIGVLRSAEQNKGSADKSAIVTALEQLTARVDQLNDLGVLHLKSADARLAFAAGIASIKAQLAVIKALPEFATESSRRRPWRIPVNAPLAAIALSVTELEELIALAIAAGSALVPKLLALRGKSTIEILDDAQADDAAAIALAELDGADAPKE